ncbi:MAG: glycoside hydrolase family 130 protein [Kiritimatiellae bacterium]|nr:glycoside hydrolase family 130 protein [Kiritimatiellia bacterium]
MADLARRFENNPILRPEDVPPSLDGLRVECVLNPGAFRYDGCTWLLLRVAECAPADETTIRVPVLDPDAGSGIRILEFDKAAPGLDLSDPRFFEYEGNGYLTTLSHLRLARSTDGRRFDVMPEPALLGRGEQESFGIEDCRVTELDGEFLLTYSAVSPDGVGIGLTRTRDWRTFTAHGMILPPHNKDCALFPAKIGGQYVALHRPFDPILGGRNMWISRSPDLRHWGEHRCIARKRPGMWDCERIGAGAAPIRTEAGWLQIYHGTDSANRYCLGAMLFDLREPATLLARSDAPIMEPTADYEKKGFFSNVVFTNGHVVDGDAITLYYGASDRVVCGATLSIRAILESLRP